MTVLFKDKEFECKCGCGLGIKDFRPSSIDRIHVARRIAGVSFVLNSAIRCPQHNAEVSKIGKTSSHLTGAFDIRCTLPRERFLIIDGLIKAGFTRLGVAKTFIHADDDPDKDQRVCWLY